MRKNREIVEENYDISHAGIINLSEETVDDEIEDFWNKASLCYDNGEYQKALQYLLWILKIRPDTDRLIFYYIRICKRVISVKLNEYELNYKYKIERKNALTRWLNWIIPLRNIYIQCKWCGRYTKYIEPNAPTFGFHLSANSCQFCNRIYPMPSWIWDSPQGRIYSYFKGSFGEDEIFYKEFERDYDPRPPKHIIDTESIPCILDKISNFNKFKNYIYIDIYANKIFSIINNELKKSEYINSKKYFNDVENFNLDDIFMIYVWFLCELINGKFYDLSNKIKNLYISNFQKNDTVKFDIIIDRFNYFEIMYKDDKSISESTLFVYTVNKIRESNNTKFKENDNFNSFILMLEAGKWLNQRFIFMLNDIFTFLSLNGIDSSKIQKLNTDEF